MIESNKLYWKFIEHAIPGMFIAPYKQDIGNCAIEYANPSLIKLIVEAQGGRIWVESEINKGSKFYITLPAN